MEKQKHIGKWNIAKIETCGKMETIESWKPENKSFWNMEIWKNEPMGGFQASKSR